MTAIDRSHVYRGTHEALVVTIYAPREAGHATAVVVLEQVVKGVPHRHYEGRFYLGWMDGARSQRDLLTMASAALSRAAEGR